MARLEELARGSIVRGILPDGLITVVDVKWHGSGASAVVELTYKGSAGRLASELVFRDREPLIEIATAGRPWSFDADGALLRLVSEAYRIRLAHLFDPLLAVHTSLVEPLPHQITAVYGEMLPRQPLRFLLADDPGAGETILAGLLIKELLVRGDLHRCLICCPGSLAEQWQDELHRRFNLQFDIITRETIEASRSGNPYVERNLVISRLDHVSRNEEIQAKLEQTDWDLVVCDEAHKMSATFFGGEVSYTKRYRLGQLLSQLTRHFLLMAATPHNGKEEDFQLFMALLDGDRFEGRFRDGVHQVDVSDLMRRLVKEKLLKFNGTPLFPERRAYAVNYKLSDAEAHLYREVTNYVREEFNRADALEPEGRKGTVGFALTILQRRLASSPEAIYQSLRGGQTEVCHLWNLVAGETREGEVFHRLFEKLEEERRALGGQVFDVLGKLTFDDRPLRDLLLEAIRYGDQPEVRARLTRVVDLALDRGRLRDLLEERALARDSMDTARVREIREDMERAEARRLQPHFIASFFLDAFKRLGGTLREREPRRYEVTHVPAAVRSRDRIIGTGAPVLRAYERVTFEKDLIALQGKPLAELVCPGHPLLDAVIDLVLEQHRDLLKQGAVLVDPKDHGSEVRALCYLEHSIQEARSDQKGNRRIVSRQLQFVEIDRNGAVQPAGYAPYLDYRPLTPEERGLVEPVLEQTWLTADVEGQATSYAISELVPRHFEEIRRRKEELIDKAAAAVKDRLTKEVNYWDHRAEEIRAQELAGRTPKLNSERARQRADELASRLKRRLEDLQQERRLSPLPPVVVGGALVAPAGLLRQLEGQQPAQPDEVARETARVERLAMVAVMEAERRLGFEPKDVGVEKRGYDVESSIPGTGRLRFLEVKGRVTGADTVTVTKNEVLTALNKPEDFILAIVEVAGDEAGEPCYVRRPFQREPDFGVTSVNYALGKLLARAEAPR